MTNKELRKEIESILKYDGLSKITLSCEVENTGDTYFATCYVSVYDDNDEYINAFSFDEIEREDIDCTDNDVIEMYKKFEKTKKAYLKKHFDCPIESVGCFNI